MGSWQLYRLDWKNKIISEFNDQFNSEIIPYNPIDFYPEKVKYKRVELSGNYLHDKEISILGKTYEGNAGFHIITPFKTENGKIILVNRGWVPKKYVNPLDRKFSLHEGEVKIIGIIRLPQKKGYFVPHNEPENGFWFTVIPNEIFKHLKLNGEKVFFVDLLREQGKLSIPIAIEGKIDLPNNHLQYAITWYSLAIGLIVVYFSWHHSNGRFKL